MFSVQHHAPVLVHGWPVGPWVGELMANTFFYSAGDAAYEYISETILSLLSAWSCTGCCRFFYGCCLFDDLGTVYSRLLLLSLIHI